MRAVRKIMSATEWRAPSKQLTQLAQLKVGFSFFDRAG
jgi:hypothetical protein